MNQNRLSESGISNLRNEYITQYLGQMRHQQEFEKTAKLTYNSQNLVSIFVSILMVGSLFLCNSLGAWEISTHRELTEKSIEAVQSDLNTYLVDNLGLEGGLNEVVGGRIKKTAREWMLEGSAREDDWDVPPRFLNHFHNPISNSGLRLSDSAIKWSLSGVGEQEWSWNDAREYYFKALTSETKDERDEYWGKTFRALGQVMHLLQDSANPSHVRSDTHLLIDGLHDYMARQSVGSYLGSGIFSPDPTLLEVKGKVRNEPFSNLFDHNVNDDGLNPSATLGGRVGVTEYTNANFFSDDTIPGQDSTDFAHPNLSELVPAPTVPFGPQYLTLPRLGSPTELKARVAKFSGNQSFSKFRLAGLQLDLLNQLQLDDLVYEAYAINLIPRAVGYSSAVLNYFFREKVPLYKDKDAYEYVIARHVLPDGPLDEDGGLTITFDIPLDMAFEGEMSLYYDLPSGQRILGDQWTWNESFRPALSNPDGTVRGTLRATVSRAPLAFDQPFRWMIVWKGKLGPGEQEQQAIIGQTGKAPWSQVCTCS